MVICGWILKSTWIANHNTFSCNVLHCRNKLFVFFQAFRFNVEIILSRISDYMDLTPVDIVGKRCYHFIHAEDVEGIRQSHLDREYPSNQSVQPPNSAKNYRMVVKEQDSVSLHALAGLIDHWSMTSWEHTVLRAKAGVMCSLQHFSVMGQQCDRQDYPC